MRPRPPTAATRTTSGSGRDTTATVAKATPATVTSVVVAGTTTMWNNTQLTGAQAQDTTTVTGAAGIEPTGTVTYVLFTGDSVCASGGAPAGTVTLGGGAVPDSTQTAPLVADNYSYQATYSGDANYQSSTGACEPFSVARNTAPGAPTINNIPSAGAALYGGAFTPAITTITDGAPSTTSSTAGICVVINSAVAFVGVGTCTLTAHTAGTANYTDERRDAPELRCRPGHALDPGHHQHPDRRHRIRRLHRPPCSPTGDGATSVASISTAVCTVGADGRTVTFVGFGVCTLTASVGAGRELPRRHREHRSRSPSARPRAGYWLVGSDGGIFSFGAADFYGSMGGIPLQRPVVGITPSASRHRVLARRLRRRHLQLRYSSYYGSIPGVGLHPAGSGLPNSLNAPIVGMVPSVTGHGYFMVASDGGVFAFGDAHFAGILSRHRRLCRHGRLGDARRHREWATGS